MPSYIKVCLFYHTSLQSSDVLMQAAPPPSYCLGCPVINVGLIHSLFSFPDAIGGTLRESIRQLEEEIEMLSDGLDLGDLIQVRGKLKSYRGMREVMAKYISE